MLTPVLVVGSVAALAWYLTRRVVRRPEGVSGTSYDREVTASSGNTYRTRTWPTVTESPSGFPVAQTGFTNAESLAIKGLFIGYWQRRDTGARKLWLVGVPDNYSGTEATNLANMIKKDFGL